MLTRIFWLGLGVAIGVLAFRKLSQTQRSLSPAGFQRTVDRLDQDLQGFSSAFRNTMASRENELRQALGLQELPRR